MPADRSLDAFAQACRSIAEPILDKPQNEISIARLLGHLFQVTKTFAMETQPQLLLLQKTMLVAEGTGRKLAPDANMWLLARPLIEDWTAETFGPEARVREAAAELRRPSLACRSSHGAPNAALSARRRLPAHPSGEPARAARRAADALRRLDRRGRPRGDRHWWWLLR